MSIAFYYRHITNLFNIVLTFVIYMQWKQIWSYWPHTHIVGYSVTDAVWKDWDSIVHVPKNGGELSPTTLLKTTQTKLIQIQKLVNMKKNDEDFIQFWIKQQLLSSIPKQWYARGGTPRRSASQTWKASGSIARTTLIIWQLLLSGTTPGACKHLPTWRFVHCSIQHHQIKGWDVLLAVTKSALVARTTLGSSRAPNKSVSDRTTPPTISLCLLPVLLPWSPVMTGCTRLSVVTFMPIGLETM